MEILSSSDFEPTCEILSSFPDWRNISYGVSITGRVDDAKPAYKVNIDVRSEFANLCHGEVSKCFIVEVGLHEDVKPDFIFSLMIETYHEFIIHYGTNMNSLLSAPQIEDYRKKLEDIINTWHMEKRYAPRYKPN